MLNVDEVRALALSFEESIEQAHFERTSFRVKKKIFATLDESKQEVVLKLSDVDQSVFSDYDDSIYPVPGAWGKKGWTKVDMQKVRKDLFKDALTCAYCEVAPKKLGDMYREA